jgi:hypothetical protein
LDENKRLPLSTKLRRWVLVPGGRGPREVVLKEKLNNTLRWFE